MQKAVEIIKRCKAEFFSIHYWSNGGVQPGQKSGPDWYYAIISNISQQIFHRNFIWFNKHYFEPNSQLTDHYWSIYNPIPGQKSGPECILATYFIYMAFFLQKAVEIIKRCKAELFSAHYWSNGGVQPGQKSGPDWYYAIISNISQQIFHRNFIWFNKHYFEPNSQLSDHYWSIYNPIPG